MAPVESRSEAPSYIFLEDSHSTILTDPWLIDSDEVFEADEIFETVVSPSPVDSPLPDGPDISESESESDLDSDSSDDEGPYTESPPLPPPTPVDSATPAVPQPPSQLPYEERRAARAARMKMLAARKPPTLQEAASAIEALQLIIRPPRGKPGRDPTKPKSGLGYKTPNLTRFALDRVSAMKAFLELYRYKLSNATDPEKSFWMEASLESAKGHQGKGPSFARSLRKWTRRFIRDKHILENPYGRWTKPRIDDEAFAQELQLHLQSIGKCVRALDMVHYLDRPEVKERWSLKKTISITTAQRWMKRLGYRWRREPKGQYADGHQRDDVVRYRQDVFLPTWTELEARMRVWSDDGAELETPLPPGPDKRRTVVWFHDESIFYKNDRRKMVWWHKSDTPKPYKKGEGASLMAANFVSADKGWLADLEGVQSARVLFKPGKGRDGYFTSDEVIDQANKAMDVFDQYPEEVHAAVYDNAKTHQKRAEDAPSARHMPKNIPKDGMNWGVDVTMRDGSGRPVHAPDGSVRKVKVQMRGAHFRDGREQPLYFPPGIPMLGSSRAWR